MTTSVHLRILMDMSTQTERPQYTVRYGDETEFFGANYPKAAKFAAENAPADIELADGTVIKRQYVKTIKCSNGHVHETYTDKVRCQAKAEPQITTSHEAQGLVRAELRAQGLDVDSVLSTQYGDVDQWKVWGSLSDGKGPFEAEVNSDGRFSIVAGAFGRLTQDGLDVFEGL